MSKSLYSNAEKFVRPTSCRAALILIPIHILSTTLYMMRVKLEFVRIIKLTKFSIFLNWRCLRKITKIMQAWKDRVNLRMFSGSFLDLVVTRYEQA